MSIQRPFLTALRFALALALVVVAAPVWAQTAVPLLVDVTWLASHLQDRDLILLHVGTQADYDAGHIAGARLISEDDLSLPHDMSKMSGGELMLELLPADVLRRNVAARGVSDASHVIVYSGKSSSVPSSTRVLFTLDYLGLGDRASLLNGGINAWTRAGKATSTTAPQITPGRLTARPTKAVVADAALVTSLPGRAGFALVDARAPVFYRGIEAGMGGEKGHIPGAINIPFSDVTDNAQTIDHAKLETLFTAAGVKAGDTVVAYCHVGQQATAVVFAARLLGHPVMLYDGSFQEWSNLHNPVEK